MLRQNWLAEIGALIGNPGRANMLDALMDGRALAAKELAAAAGITPQTASGHLAKLLDVGLVAVTSQGRYRYHRLTSPEVASLLESMAQFATRSDGRSGFRTIRTGPREAAMRLARTCYNRVAGRLGVGIADAMLVRGQVEFDEDGGAVTEAGRDFLQGFGIALPGTTRGGRTFCRPCMDWSERRPHLAGAKATALAGHCFELGWLRCIDASRALAITPIGQKGFREAFGLDTPRR
jgi:DNA-binding transcriptional ArsR family regulator